MAVVLVTDLATELAAIRRMLDDHERRLYPVDHTGLPAPTAKRTGSSMDGLWWRIPVSDRREWIVISLADRTEHSGCIFVHSPDGLIGDPGDVVAVPYDDARRLAGCLVAAVNASTDELSAKRRDATSEGGPA